MQKKGGEKKRKMKMLKKFSAGEDDISKTIAMMSQHKTKWYLNCYKKK